MVLFSLFSLLFGFIAIVLFLVNIPNITVVAVEYIAENMAILIILVGQMLFIAFVGYMIKRKLAHLGKIKNLELQMQWVLKYRKGELEYRKGYEQGMHERITLLESRVSNIE